jgi:putative pyruvate formate lyase activating enzyme
MYLADLKFGSDACAKDLAGIDRYWEVVTRNLLAAGVNTPLLVRHLAMPGHIDCCLRPVASWMERNLPDAPFHVGRGYVPAYRAGSCGTLGRCLSAAEERDVEELVAGYRGRLAA